MIKEVVFWPYSELLRGKVFQLLAPFFKNNDSLSKIHIWECELNADIISQLSSSLRVCNKSLKQINIENAAPNQVALDIITALSMQPQLKEVELSFFNFRRIEFTALAAFLTHNASELQLLITDVDDDFDEEGLHELVHAIISSNRVQNVTIRTNQSTTIDSWNTLSTLLSVPDSKLTNLSLSEVRVDGNARSQVFANALASNSTLKSLSIRGDSITREAWVPFAKLLCDTSSVNKTYLSNHTLEGLTLGSKRLVPTTNVATSLRYNALSSSQAAIAKILRYHSHFDVQPFFEWELKVLPIMLEWFAKAADCTNGYEEKIGRMTLDAMYDFIKHSPCFALSP